MKVMAKKKVTIEDLAIMTQKGFFGMDKKFEGVDKKIEGVDKKIEGLKNEMNNRFDKIENILIRAHENRLDKIEDDIRVLKTLVGKR